MPLSVITLDKIDVAFTVIAIVIIVLLFWVLVFAIVLGVHEHKLHRGYTYQRQYGATREPRFPEPTQPIQQPESLEDDSDDYDDSIHEPETREEAIEHFRALLVAIIDNEDHYGTPNGQLEAWNDIRRNFGYLQRFGIRGYNDFAHYDNDMGRNLQDDLDRAGDVINTNDMRLDLEFDTRFSG